MARRPAPLRDVGEPEGDRSLGEALKLARRSLGLSLRAVEERTGRQVTNGYLSQIEGGSAAKPSPKILGHLADVYGLDYGSLLARAGHRVPDSDRTEPRADIGEFPMSVIEELSAAERDEVLKYVAFIRARRQAR